ncbi:HEAT repeat domain-containing protein [Candidatus Micrarchaeota archaeon]|nr:HEAT repeat domain-containing protein [Candidatus Micrarchaeota archaeon]
MKLNYKRIGVVALLSTTLVPGCNSSKKEPIVDTQTAKQDGKKESGSVIFLIEALNDNNAEAKVNAIRDLERIGAPAVPQLIQAWKTSKIPVQKSITEAIVKIGKIAVPELIEALKDADIRKHTAEALGEIGDKRAVPQLMQEIHGNPSEVQKAVIEALGKIGDPQVVPVLIEEYKSGNARLEIVNALGRMGDKRATPVFTDALKSPDATMVIEAAFGLGTIADPKTTRPLLEALRNTENDNARNRITFTLSKIGKPAVPELIKALNDERINGYAAEALGRIKDARALPALINIVKNKKSKIRANAALSLGLIGDRMAVPALMAAYRENNVDLQKIIALTLGEIKDNRSVPLLVEALKHEDVNVRLMAAHSLGKIGDKSVVPVLIEAMENGNTYAIEALGNIGDASAIPALEREKSKQIHDDQVLYSQACIAIRRIESRSEK